MVFVAQCMALEGFTKKKNGAFLDGQAKAVKAIVSFHKARSVRRVYQWISPSSQ